MSQDIHEPQFKIRPSGQNFSVDVVLASYYGLEEAFLIHHFQHWIRINKTSGKNFIDGSYWSYQTMKEIADHFPFLNYEKVKYAIENLVKQKVLKTANYNKIKLDKTNWYAFIDEDIYLPEIPKKSKNVYERENSPSKGKIPHPEGKIPEPIPDTKPMSKTSSLKDNVFCKDNSEDTDSKFPLKKEQLEIFAEMKALDLGTDDKTLTIIFRKAWKEKGVDFLKDCIHHMRYLIESGFHFKKEKIAFFRNCLSGKQSLITSQCLENKKLAGYFCKSVKWSDVKITEKYASICNAEGNLIKEIPMSLPEEEFKKQFEELYKLYQEYR